MSAELKNNKFLSYFLILISLFIIILFTSSQIMKVQENNDRFNQLDKEITDVREQQEELQKIKQQITQSGAVTQRYLSDFTENEMLDYLYTYQETSNNAQWNIQITSISLTQAQENDFGFLEKEVNVEAIVSDEQVMKDFLNYLVAEDAKYRFFISDFNFPNDGREGGYNISIPLKIFYR